MGKLTGPDTLFVDFGGGGGRKEEKGGEGRKKGEGAGAGDLEEGRKEREKPR